MKKVIIALVCGLLFFDSFLLAVALQKQHVVRLVGGSSSGKSSLEKEILQECDNWVVIDDDDLCFDYMRRALQKRFPYEFSIISEGIEERNLYHAFLRNQVCFRREISLEKREEILRLLSNIRKELDEPCNIEWRHSVWKSVEVKMIEDIRKAVFEGKHVLMCASSFPLNALEEEIFPLKIVKVLLYSPLNVSFDRLIERNEAAMRDENYEIKRFPTSVAESFCRLMKLTQDKDLACDVGSRYELEETFDRVIEKIESVRPVGALRTFTQYDFSEEQVRVWEKDFFSSLEEDKDLCYITPKDTYDVILRSDEASPEELSQLLLDELLLLE